MNELYRIRFSPSTRKGKKYMATLVDGTKIHFGAKGYEQYKDSTGLGIYSKFDHMDKKRRENYFSRHSGGSRTKQAAINYELKRSPKITARLLSHMFLW